MYIYKPVTTKVDATKIYELSEKLNISSLLSRLLWQRGITDAATAAAFLNPSLSNLNDPFLLPDIDIAVECIKQAVADGDKIAVYGDYDVDGISASAVMLNTLQKMGADVIYYLPDRFTEGYGVNPDAIYKLHEEGVRLIVTVDCGITALEEVELANRLGMCMIITDHHTCLDELPNAKAVINPHRPDSIYPFSDLAGVGIAFKLACALVGQETAAGYIDIVALGTVADIVPLIGENRVIVHYGLQHINNAPREGIKALLSVSGLNNPVGAWNIAFQLAPRLNAAGRMSSAAKGLEVLLCEDADKALGLARSLDADNRQRQNVEKQMLEEAMAIINSDIDLRHERAIVLAKEGWHQGVIGITAGKLADMYHRPVLMVALADGQGHGSARSIPNLNIYNALNQCKKYFLALGGHSQAAGFSILKEDVSAMRRKLNEILENLLTYEDIIPVINYDLDIALSDISPKLVDELKLLEPFGTDNKEPMFLIKNVPFKDMREVGTDKAQLKLCLSSGGQDLDCIAFRNGNKYQELYKCKGVDVIGSLEFNTWNGMQRVQLKAAHVRPSNDEINLAAFVDHYYDNITDIFVRDNTDLQDDDLYIKDLLKTKFNSSEQRDEWLINHLKGSMNNLILVNTPFQLNHLLSELRAHDLINVIDRHYNCVGNDAVIYNVVLVNAELSSLDLKPFANVILYDVPFSSSYIAKLADKIIDQQLYLIFGHDQIESNKEVLVQWALSRREMEHLYKALKYAGRRSLRYNINIKALEQALAITKQKIYLGLDIFKRAGLIDYAAAPDDLLYITLLQHDGKVDLFSDPKYEAMQTLRKSFKNFEKYVKIKHD